MRVSLPFLLCTTALAWWPAVVVGCGGIGGSVHELPRPASDVGAWATTLEARLSVEAANAELLSQLALARMHQGRLTEAEQLASRAVSRSTCHAVALAVSARIAAERRVFEVAVRRYELADQCAGGRLGERALEARLEAHMALASERLMAGQAGAAITLLRRARGWSRSSDQDLALGGVADRAAQAALRQGARGLAVEGLEIAAVALAGAPTNRRLSGQLAVLRGRADQGARELAAWAESSGERWADVARFYGGVDDPQRALEAWRRAASQEQATFESWSALAMAALELRQLSEAIRAISRAASLAPTRTAGADYLVEFAALLGNETQAERLASRAVELAPTHWPAIRALVAELARGQREEEVSRVLLAYVSRAEEPTLALDRSAELLDAVGMRRGAVRLLEATVASATPPAGAELTLVRLLHKRRGDWGRRNEVLEAYEDRVRGDVEASVAVGKLWVKYRHPGRARTIAERLRKRHPERFEGGLLMADALRAVGRRSSEAAIISETIAAAADPVRAALAIGLRYLEWREHTRATTWLETAAAGKPTGGLEREVRRGLIDAHMGQHPPAHQVAARHMRRWIALTPEDEEVRAIEHLLQRIAGVTAFGDLRIELLQRLASRRPDDSDVLESLGQGLLLADRWDMAKEVFEAAMSGASSSKGVAIRAGRLFLAAGRNTTALSFFERVNLQPTDLDIQTWRSLGEYLYTTGHPDRADAYFAKLLERTASGGHLSELTIFARVALRLGAWERAVQAARQILDRRAEHRDAMLVIGEASTRLGEHRDAEEWFQRYVHAAPPAQRSKAWLIVGGRMETMGRLGAAAAHFEAALQQRVNTLPSVAFERLASARRRMGDQEGLSRAVRLFVAHADSSRSAARATLSAAKVLEQAGMHERAWLLLTDALDRASGDRTLLEAAAGNALERGDVEAALGLYRRLVQQRGTSSRVWVEVSQKLVDAGHAEAALTLLSESAERPGASAMVHVVLGQRLLERARLDEADAAFQRAITQARSLGEVAKSVEAAYRSVGQLRRLEAFFVGLVAMAPTRGDPPLTLGAIRLELGAPVGAEQAFARYLAAHPRGHLAVAEAYARFGEVRQALAHYRRAWEQPAPGASSLPLEKLAEWLVVCGHGDALGWFVNLHVRRAQDPGAAAREASEAYGAVGNVAQALRWLHEADTLDPDAKHDMARGALALAAGDVVGARRAWGRYIERRRGPGGRPRSGRTKSTRTMAEAAVEVSERWAQARRLEEAIRTVREVAERYGDAPLLAVSEARYLVRMGQVEAGLARARDQAGPALAPAVKQAPPGAVQALVEALRDRDRDVELVALLEDADVASWSHDLGLVLLTVLADLERWDEAVQLAGTLTRTGKPELDLSVGLQAFRKGLYDLAAHHLGRALRGGIDDPLEATRALDATQLLRGPVEVAPRIAAFAPDDRLGQLVLSAQRRADKRDLTGALTDAIDALRLAPDDLRIFDVALSLAVAAGDAPRLEALLATLRSRQHPRLAVLKVAVKRLAHGLRPELARRLQAELIAAQPGVAEHHLVAVGLALQAGDDVAGRWHTDALLAVAGDEPRTLLQLAERWQRWMRPDAAEALLARLDEAAGAVAVEREMVRLRGALMARDVERAAAAVATALEVGADDPRLRLRVAALSLDLGASPEQAAGWLRPALDAGYRTDAALALAARAAWRMGDLEAAREHLEGLLPMHQVDISLWGRVLGAAIGAGDVVALGQLVDHLPTRVTWPVPALAMVGMVSASLEHEAPRMGEEPRAVMAAAVQRLIERAKKVARNASPALAAAVALAAEVRGDHDGAVAAYEVPLVADPRSPVHANNLAYVLSRFGRELDRALELVVSAQARAGEPVTSYTDTEAWVRYRMGDYEGAHQLMAITVHGAHERESKSPAGQVEMLYHYASTLEAVGEAGRAWSIWRDCARRAPLSPYGRLCAERLEALPGRPRR